MSESATVRVIPERTAISQDASEVQVVVSVTAPKKMKTRMFVRAYTLLDTSGSMSGGKMEAVRSMMSYVLSSLENGDELCIIPFDSSAHTAFPLAALSASTRPTALGIIQKLDADGGTVIGSALTAALTAARARAAVNDATNKSRWANVILLLSDGEDGGGLGSQASTVPKATKLSVSQEAASLGLPIYTFGFGSGIGDAAALLGRLADETGGTFSFVKDSTAEAVSQAFGSVLARIASTAMEEAVVQVQIGPESSYGTGSSGSAAAQKGSAAGGSTSAAAGGGGGTPSSMQGGCGYHVSSVDAGPHPVRIEGTIAMVSIGQLATGQKFDITVNLKCDAPLAPASAGLLDGSRSYAAVVAGGAAAVPSGGSTGSAAADDATSPSPAPAPAAVAAALPPIFVRACVIAPLQQAAEASPPSPIAERAEPEEEAAFECARKMPMPSWEEEGEEGFGVEYTKEGLEEEDEPTQCSPGVVAEAEISIARVPAEVAALLPLHPEVKAGADRVTTIEVLQEATKLSAAGNTEAATEALQKAESEVAPEGVHRKILQHAQELVAAPGAANLKAELGQIESAVKTQTAGAVDSPMYLLMASDEQIAEVAVAAEMTALRGEVMKRVEIFQKAAPGLNSTSRAFASICKRKTGASASAAAAGGGGKSELVVKHFPRLLGSAGADKEACRVAYVWKRLKHPHIQPLLDFSADGKDVCFVTARADGNSLFDVLTEAGNEEEEEEEELQAGTHGNPLNSTAVSHVGLQLAEALQYLHTVRGGQAAGGSVTSSVKPLVHRSVTPANILLQSCEDAPDAGSLSDAPYSWNVKLSDYGSAALTKVQNFGFDFAGCYPFMAPELLRGEEYGTAVDIWGYGATLFFAATGEYVAAGSDDFASIKRGDWSFAGRLGALPEAAVEVWEGVPEDLKELISWCLSVDPADRPTAAEILEHDAFIDTHSDLKRLAAKKRLLGVAAAMKAVGSGALKTAFSTVDLVDVMRGLSGDGPLCDVPDALDIQAVLSEQLVRKCGEAGGARELVVEGCAALLLPLLQEVTAGASKRDVEAQKRLLEVLQKMVAVPGAFPTAEEASEAMQRILAVCLAIMRLGTSYGANSNHESAVEEGVSASNRRAEEATQARHLGESCKREEEEEEAGGAGGLFGGDDSW